MKRRCQAVIDAKEGGIQSIEVIVNHEMGTEDLYPSPEIQCFICAQSLCCFQFLREYLYNQHTSGFRTMMTPTYGTN